MTCVTVASLRSACFVLATLNLSTAAPRINAAQSVPGIAGIPADELKALLAELSPLPVRSMQRGLEGDRYHYVITVDARSLAHSSGDQLVVSFYLDADASRAEFIAAISGAMRQIRLRAVAPADHYPIPGTAIEPLP